MMINLTKDNSKEAIVAAVRELQQLVSKLLDESGGDSGDFSNLVDEFIQTFPTRTPGGRILSPASINTVSGRKIEKKLALATKRNVNKLNYLIQKLKDEVKYRKTQEGKIEFMKGIEVWINSGEWENTYKQERPNVTGVARGITI